MIVPRVTKVQLISLLVILGIILLISISFQILALTILSIIADLVSLAAYVGGDASTREDEITRNDLTEEGDRIVRRIHSAKSFESARLSDSENTSMRSMRDPPPRGVAFIVHLQIIVS